MTRRKRKSKRPEIILLILLLLVVGAVWGWYRATRTITRDVTFYFTDAQAMYLVPVTEERTLPKNEAKALDQILEELSRPPAGLQATLPPGAVAEVQRISNAQANVSLQLPASMGSGAERLLAGAVVKTAASLGTVREVRLQLRDPQGNPYESQHLDLSTPLTPTDPGIENLYLDGAGEGLMVTLYYATPDGRFLVPLRRPLPPAYRSQPLEGSFQLLMAGPPPELNGILGPSVPADPGIGWGGVTDGVARIHWPPDRPAPSEHVLRAFALTLTEFDGIQQVSLSQQGQEIASTPRPKAVNSVHGAPAAPLPASPSPATDAPANGSLMPESPATESVYPAP
jgi:spore germination protein GerM